MKKNKLLLLASVVIASLVILGSHSPIWAQSKEKSALQQSRGKAVSSRAVKLPDLIVSDIKLIKDCKIEITLKNIGTAGVPASGYDLHKGAGIQMYKSGKAWGGIRLGAVDRSGRLKTPGNSVKHVWFPGAANLALGAGTHSIKVIVDNNNAVAELNEKNNSKTVRLTCKNPVAGKKTSRQVKGGSKAPAGVQQKKTLQMQTAKLPTGVQQKGTLQMQGTQIPGGAQKIVMPDLVVTSFSINQSAGQQVDNYFNFPFSVLVKNIGEGDVQNAYDLSFQFYDDVHNSWGGENQPGFNCKRINNLLKSGTLFSFGGTLRLMNYQISNQNLKVRAYVDSACSQEFPNAWGHVAEGLKEDNNYSNQVTLTGGYYPHIGSITPGVWFEGSGQVMIGGMGFGATQGTHTVKLRKGTNQTEANIQEWHDGVIYITIPSGAKAGINKVSIADKNTLNSRSNEVDLTVYDVLTWSRLIDVWDLFNAAFEIKLNTYNGGCSYKNTSTIKLLQSTDINVPKIEFNMAGLKYRFNVRDMNSIPEGITLSKQGCGPNQLRMEVAFEDNGTELKGCNSALGPGGVWCDGCVADIHIDNGKMVIVFNFSANGGNLDFGLSTSFSADVRASNNFADALMNAFLGNWNQDVINNVNNGVRSGLLEAQNKSYVLSEFTKVIKMLLGIPSNKQITDIQFRSDGIHVTY